MNEKQRKRLIELIGDLRSIAEPIGPQHSFWDVIMDIDCLLRGDETMVKMSIDGWILYCEQLLKKYRPS